MSFACKGIGSFGGGGFWTKAYGFDRYERRASGPERFLSRREDFIFVAGGLLSINFIWSDAGMLLSLSLFQISFSHPFSLFSKVFAYWQNQRSCAPLCKRFGRSDSVCVWTDAAERLICPSVFNINLSLASRPKTRAMAEMRFVGTNLFSVGLFHFADGLHQFWSFFSHSCTFYIFRSLSNSCYDLDVNWSFVFF